MTQDDSPILDFYPERFVIDLNGKKYAWQGVAILPFIEEQRLLNAMKDYSANLTEEERVRNEMGNDLLFVSRGHPLYETLCDLYGHKKADEEVSRLFELSGHLLGAGQNRHRDQPRAAWIRVTLWRCLPTRIHVPFPTAQCWLAGYNRQYRDCVSSQVNSDSSPY